MAFTPKTDWIDGSLPASLKLLPGGQRGCVGNVADVEIGNDAEDALLFLDFDLACATSTVAALLAFRRGGGNNQSILLDREGLAGCRIPENILGRKNLGKKCELEGAGPLC